jgi:hypothetical protein
VLRGSVFEARRRLDDFCNFIATCGHCDRNSRFLAGREAATSILFSCVKDDSHLAMASCSHTASRASSATSKTPVPVPPVCTGLPDRDTSLRAPHSTGFPVELERRLTSTGPWTERRTCPESSVQFEMPFDRCVALLWRTLTTFPSSASKGHPLSPARLLEGGETSPSHLEGDNGPT